MKTRYHILWSIMLVSFLVTPAPVLAQDESGVSVVVADNQGDPLAGVKASLFLYQFKDTEAEVIPSGNCRTDENGRCQISITQKAPRDQGGFLRGYLVVGEYGQRTLLWPGGQLEVNVWLDQAGSLDVARESKPYDWQKQDDNALEITTAPQLRAGDVLVLLAIIGGWLGIIFWRTK